MFKAQLPILLLVAVTAGVVSHPSNASSLEIGGQASRSHGERGDRIDVVMRSPVRSLPFQLSLGGAEAPHDLGELIETLYASLPNERLQMIAAYFGGDGYQVLRSRYLSSEDFFEDLYISESLAEVARHWPQLDSPRFNRARNCVGYNFNYLVALQIGVKYQTLHTPEGHASSDLAIGYRRASSVARRLFEVCGTIRR